MSLKNGHGLRPRLGRIYRWTVSRWLGLRSATPLRQLRSMQLRRLEPLAGGTQRGQAVIRYYWSRFLEDCRDDIRGRALEIGDTGTVRQLGRGLSRTEALDMAPRSGVDVVADLSRADHVPPDTYDCFVVPFTTHFIYDIEAALYHAIRILKPGGVLLINFPCVDYDFPTGLEMNTGKPLYVFWWFTPLQVENLFRRIGLGAGDIDVRVFGNLFARMAYQLNMPVEELTAEERDHRDLGHPLLVCARIVKPRGWSAPRPPYRDAWVPGGAPIEWNPATGHYPRR